ncbi:Na+/H+ antiporter NhaC family protein [Stieleria varia]|uniref:Malate-2H(+)/Na(+)-lactate antiporter n=1 Tax=Stieleria varia TaxID=2528005 RepID=A0A5C6B102_9BACT|nr:Na+/H+ antiporter NhaC family protein [Stieleria varia]TWU05588.1 Malate-2H(+)/Na(+)-lactate antiporter [Stieleria varia]
MDFGFDSLMPPLVAICLAIATQRVVLPLALGVFCGAVMLAPHDSILLSPLLYFRYTMQDSIMSTSHLQALLFSLLLGAMVGVLEIGGGMRSLIGGLAKTIRSRRGAQTLVATSGLAVFFDDYANTLLVGGTMRSTADRYGMSRSKLAYLVDSTAAPVAGLSIISTWAATEISYMSDGLMAAGITDRAAGFELFIRSIPYRFYPLLALVMVFIIARTGRDFGPMRSAEQEAMDRHLDGGGSAENGSGDDEAVSSLPRYLWLAAIIPVLLCIAVVGVVLMITGYLSLGPQNAGLPTWKYLGLVFSNGDSYRALIAGGAIGWAATSLMHLGMGGCRPVDLFWGTYRGAKQMMPAMVILWFAWALSALTEPDRLNTSGYLAAVLSNGLDVRLLPAIVFVIAGLTAFSTGTSWGTMGILTPLSVSLAITMDPSGGPGGAICLATCGSVLAGAIFGDHCSPISDTTVLSSRASGCDHVRHVRTQMPYAIIVAAVCIAVGCVPAALGVSPWISLLAGSVVLVAIVRWVGKEPVLHEENESPG